MTRQNSCPPHPHPHFHRQLCVEPRQSTPNLQTTPFHTHRLQRRTIWLLPAISLYSWEELWSVWNQFVGIFRYVDLLTSVKYLLWILTDVLSFVIPDMCCWSSKCPCATVVEGCFVWRPGFAQALKFLVQWCSQKTNVSLNIKNSGILKYLSLSFPSSPFMQLRLGLGPMTGWRFVQRQQRKTLHTPITRTPPPPSSSSQGWAGRAFCLLGARREGKLKITFPFYGKGTGIKKCHGKGTEIWGL